MLSKSRKGTPLLPQRSGIRSIVYLVLADVFGINVNGFDEVGHGVLAFPDRLETRRV